MDGPILMVVYKYATLLSLGAILITCIAWIDDIGPRLKSARWMVRRVAIISTTVGSLGLLIKVWVGDVQPQLSLTLLVVGLGLGMAAHVEAGWWNFVWKGRPRRAARTPTAPSHK